MLLNDLKFGFLSHQIYNEIIVLTQTCLMQKVISRLAGSQRLKKMLVNENWD